MSRSKVKPLVAGPHLTRAASGVIFDVNSDLWRLREGSNRDLINIGAITPLVSPQLENSICVVFAAVAGGRPGNTAASWFYVFRSLVEFVAKETERQIVEFDAEHIAVWVHKASGTNLTALSHIRSIILTWEKLRSPGLTEDAIDLVKRLRRSKDPTILGVVISWDPVHGPYRPAEDEAIRDALDRAFNDGTISLATYTMFRTFRATGARPESLSQLKVGDLRTEGDHAFLRIPMAKQQGDAWRDSFMPWKPITQGFGNLLAMHIEESIRPRIDKNMDISQAPIFPSAHPLLNETPSCHVAPRYLSDHYRKEFFNLYRSYAKTRNLS
jgi:hypothetical protein